MACRLFDQICYHVLFHIASNNDSSFNEKFYEDEYEFIWLNIHSVLYYDEKDLANVMKLIRKIQLI